MLYLIFNQGYDDGLDNGCPEAARGLTTEVIRLARVLVRLMRAGLGPIQAVGPGVLMRREVPVSRRRKKKAKKSGDFRRSHYVTSRRVQDTPVDAAVLVWSPGRCRRR